MSLNSPSTPTLSLPAKVLIAVVSIAVAASTLGGIYRYMQKHKSVPPAGRARPPDMDSLPMSAPAINIAPSYQPRWPAPSGPPPAPPTSTPAFSFAPTSAFALTPTLAAPTFAARMASPGGVRNEAPAPVPVQYANFGMAPAGDRDSGLPAYRVLTFHGIPVFPRATGTGHEDGRRATPDVQPTPETQHTRGMQPSGLHHTHDEDTSEADFPPEMPPAYSEL